MEGLDWEKPEQFQGDEHIGNCKFIGRATKIRIYNSTVKAVLLYT